MEKHQLRDEEWPYSWRVTIYRPNLLKSLQVKVATPVRYERTYLDRTSASAWSQSASGEPGRSARSSQIR